MSMRASEIPASMPWSSFASIGTHVFSPVLSDSRYLHILRLYGCLPIRKVRYSTGWPVSLLRLLVCASLLVEYQALSMWDKGVRAMTDSMATFPPSRLGVVDLYMNSSCATLEILEHSTEYLVDSRSFCPTAHLGPSSSPPTTWRQAQQADWLASTALQSVRSQLVHSSHSKPVDIYC